MIVLASSVLSMMHTVLNVMERNAVSVFKVTVLKMENHVNHATDLILDAHLVTRLPVLIVLISFYNPYGEVADESKIQNFHQMNLTAN